LPDQWRNGQGDTMKQLLKRSIRPIRVAIMLGIITGSLWISGCIFGSNGDNKPEPAFLYNHGGPYSGAVGTSITFFNGRGVSIPSTVTYEWDFDNDGTYDWTASSVGDPVHTYTSAGEFEAGLRVTDSEGVISTTKVTVWIYELHNITTATFEGAMDGHLWPTSNSSSVDISSDGQYVVSVGEDGAKIWQVSDGTLLHTLDPMTQGMVGFKAIAITNDGHVVGANIALGKANISVWDLSDGQFVRKTDRIRAFEFYYLQVSSDSKYAVVITHNSVVVVDIQTGRVVHTIEPDSRPVSLAITPDDQHIVVGDRDGNISIYNISYGTTVRNWTALSYESSIHNQVTSIAVTPDGSQIVAVGGADSSLRVWTFDGTFVRAMRAQTTLSAEPYYNPVHIRITSDGKYLVGSIHDGTTGQLAKWNLADGSLVTQYSTSTLTSGIAIAGDKIVSMDQNSMTVKLWDLNSGEEMRQLGIGISNHQLISHDGTYVLTSSGTSLYFWNRETKLLERTWLDVVGGVRGITLIPNGDRVAIMSDDGVIIRNLQSDDSRILGTGTQPVAIATSANGLRIASALFDGSIKIWNTHNGNLEQTISAFKSDISSVTLSPDGQYVAAYGLSEDGRIQTKVWNVSDEILESTSGFASPKIITGLAGITGDGHVVGNNGPLVYVWDIHTGALLRELSVQAGYHTTLSPDGQYLISEYGAYQLSDGAKIAGFTPHQFPRRNTRAVSISSDARYILVADASNGTEIFRTE
jgi:WD40 repeat protein